MIKIRDFAFCPFVATEGSCSCCGVYRVTVVNTTGKGVLHEVLAYKAREAAVLYEVTLS